MSFSEILMKGIVLFDNQMYLDAIKQFNKAIKLNKNDDEPYFCIANCLCCLKRFEEGIEFYNKAIQLNPNDFDSFHNKGILDFSLKIL